MLYYTIYPGEYWVSVYWVENTLTSEGNIERVNLQYTTSTVLCSSLFYSTLQWKLSTPATVNLGNVDHLQNHNQGEQQGQSDLLFLRTYEQSNNFVYVRLPIHKY